MLVGAAHKARTIRSLYHNRHRRHLNLQGVLKLPYGAMKESLNSKRFDATAEGKRPTQREVGRAH
jgi:hypothetical protein